MPKKSNDKQLTAQEAGRPSSNNKYNFFSNPNARIDTPFTEMPLTTTSLDIEIAATAVKAFVKEIHERSKSILEDWRILGRILERHEETIRKRWTKKETSKKKKLLHTICPNIPATYGARFQVFHQNTTCRADLTVPETKLRDLFLWPEVNLESLTQKHALPLFLNARSRNTPASFASADKEVIEVATLYNVVVPIALDSLVIFSHPSARSNTRSPFRWWDTSIYETYQEIESGVYETPGHRLLLLERLQHIYSFLLNCCYHILHDFPRHTLVRGDVTKGQEPLPSDTADTDQCCTAVKHLFCAPSPASLESIQSLANAKRSEVEDHIWSLRVDPSYFVSTVTEWNEHYQTAIGYETGRPLAEWDTPRSWDRVLRNAIGEGYIDWLLWTTISEKVETLMELRNAQTENKAETRTLPLEPAVAAQELSRICRHAKQIWALRLATTIPASPGFRSLFIRDRRNPNIVKPLSESDAKKDYLLWLIGKIPAAVVSSTLMVANEFERLIKNQASQRKRLSPLLLRSISVITMLAEVERQSAICYPLEFEEFVFDPLDEVFKSFPEIGNLWAILEPTSLSAFGTPSGDRFFYPVGKRRTQETVNAMRKAEAHLDLLWKIVDQSLVTSPPNSPLRHMSSKQLSVQRTPVWVEPIESVNSSNKTVISILSCTSLFDKFSTTDPTFFPSSKRDKVKTRGVSAVTEIETLHDNADNAGQNAPAVKSKLMVDQRAHDVFSMLFYSPSARDQPGELPWTEFCYAMTSAGFASEQHGGSGWQFVSEKRHEGRKSIVIHGPHPRPKIPFVNARRISRRLTSTFGWTLDTFALE